MTLQNSILGHEVTINSVNKVVTTDVFLNIVKRKETLLYRSTVAPVSANIAYTSGPQISVDNCLSIADRSTSLAANRAVKSGYTTIIGVKAFSINTESFLVTDVFVQPTNTIIAVPLFYAHTLNTTNVPRVSLTDLSLATGVKIVSIEILDWYFQSRQVTELSLDYDTGVLYNNLESYYKSSAKYEFFYIKYVVNNNGVIHTFIDLLDNAPVYRLATFSDLDSEMQIIADGRKVYLIEETDSGFDVTLPIVGTYAYKPLTAARIQVLSPTTSEEEDPWYARITNGKFYTVIGVNTLKYYIAEFSTQVFFPEYPFKNVTLEESTVLNSTTIKLDNSNIAEDSSLDMGITLEIDDISDNAIAAFTTLDSMVGELASNGKPYVKWTNVAPVGIRSIDRQNGLLDIDGLVLDEDWVVTTNYYYSETNYVFTLVNFNPISNRAIVDTTTVFFLVPESSSTILEQTLFYLSVDPSGRVVASNWDGFDNETQTVIANGKQLYYGTKPSWQTNPALWENFISVYSTEGSGTYLILADLTTGVGSSIDDVSIIDSRIRGGGISDEDYDTVINQYPELAWAWDIGAWDGIPFPGNATFLIEVPVGVMEGAGGTFTQNEVVDIIKRHMALGVYPVVRAYGIETTVSGIVQGNNTLTIEWTGHGY